jgi:uncharacterized protein YjbJ (UPF0337 family)
MDSSTKDQVEGKLHEIKGGIKKRAGRITDNPKMEAEGQSERFKGQVQKKVGQIEKVFEN